MSIGQELIKARESKGFTLREMAELIGIDHSQLSRYESGKQTPRFSTLRKIADALDYPSDYFYPSRTKCIYCNPNDEEWDWNTLPINAGDFGKYELTASVNGYRKHMTVEFEEVGHEPILSTHFKINYCPYCGRKF